MSEWIEHDGDDCPVNIYASVNWRTVDPEWHQNDDSVAVAKSLDWKKKGEGSDIVSYRVVSP